MAQGEQRLLITTKLIEISRPAESADTPTGKYERKLSDPQFQKFICEVSQKKGADLMTAPSVVTRDGQKATIEVIREFTYPGAPGEDAEHETENVGVASHIDAEYAGNKAIDLKTFTRVTEFDGFSEVSPDFELPVFNRRDIETSVRLENGETLVVGGIVDVISQDVVDSAVLGLIKRRSTHHFSRELILTVTASLIKPDGTRIAAR